MQKMNILAIRLPEGIQPLPKKVATIQRIAPPNYKKTTMIIYWNDQSL
jgi:hypothetical protein